MRPIPLLLFCCLCSQVLAQTGISKIPVVHINTNGQTIQDSNKIQVEFGITDYPDGNLYNEKWNSYSGYAGIEYHGQSTLQFDKKCYGLELRDSAGEEIKASLLGMSAESGWILVANYNDKSLIRNALGYTLAAATGQYAPRTHFCELMLDSVYQGTYLLVERIMRDSLRVPVAKLDSDDIAGDSLTGGYIVRIDHPEDANGWYSAQKSSVYYQHYYPKYKNIGPEQLDYIEGYVNDFEAMMMGDSFADPATGYPAWIDTRSFADYILHQELIRNVDAYRLSTFFYKNRDDRDPLLHAGPVWDMDISAGNANYYNGASPEGWTYDVTITDQFQRPDWWERLAEEPAFQQILNCRWKGLRSEAWSDTRLFATLDSLVDVVDSAAAHNFERWPILNTYVYPNAYIGGTWEAEIDSLRSWLEHRLAWMDEQFSSTCTDTIFTNTFNVPETHNTLSFVQRETSLLWNAVPSEVVIFDLTGRSWSAPQLGTMTDLSNLPTGTWLVAWKRSSRNSWKSRLVQF
ncbi:MAG TPA: CotH kinase family protein [Fibrobacteraceae bacterium]|nr:CotH kinase family protein [Fibrobacteraceae bacterium]